MGSHGKNPVEFFNITALNVLQELSIVILFEVPTLGKDLIAMCPVSLNRLYIYDFQARKIGDKVFEKLVNLEHLIVRANIDDFRRSMLPSPAPYLETLDLRYVDQSINSIHTKMA